ncbi:MAG: PEP-CTERM sorting domain-containing protein [Deltaproteobacteria bacterium]|nr:PEP-CTERM sorting domain-containing protein [Deltaproteobacteria bacterium]
MARGRCRERELHGAPRRAGGDGVLPADRDGGELPGRSVLLLAVRRGERLDAGHVPDLVARQLLLDAGPPGACATALAAVGNLQIGTSAPVGLLDDDVAYAFDIDQVSLNPIPEPGTALLMGLGLAGLAAAGRRETRA